MSVLYACAGGALRSFTDEQLASAARTIAADLYTDDIDGWLLSGAPPAAITIDREAGYPRLFVPRVVGTADEARAWPMGLMPALFLDEPQTLESGHRELLEVSLVSGLWESLRDYWLPIHRRSRMATHIPKELLAATGLPYYPR